MELKTFFSNHIRTGPKKEPFFGTLAIFFHPLFIRPFHKAETSISQLRIARLIL